jgi:hypothetical protein
MVEHRSLARGLNALGQGNDIGVLVDVNDLLSTYHEKPGFDYRRTRRAAGAN